MLKVQNNLLILLIVTAPCLTTYKNLFGVCEDHIKHLPEYSCAESNNIGTGSNGTCFLIQNAENKQFVLKVQKENKWSQREVEAIKKLENKKYIIQMKEDRVVENLHLSIIQYGSRRTLEEVLKTSDHFDDIWKVIDFFKKLLIGLQSVKDAGLVHCQITLKTVLVRDNFDPLIIDFGVSTQINSTESFRGVPVFMPPELVQAMNYETPFTYTTSLDVYSAGVVLFYMMRSHFPFGDYEMNYFKMINSPVKFQKGSSTLFMNVIIKCLQLRQNRWNLANLISYLDKNAFPEYEYPLSDTYYYTLGNSQLFVKSRTLEEIRFWVLTLVVLGIILFSVSILFYYCQICFFMMLTKSDKDVESSKRSLMNVKTNFINSEQALKVGGDTTAKEIDS